MNTRDLVEQLNGYLKENKPKWESLAQAYIQECKEFFEENKNSVSCQTAHLIGIPIEDFCINDQTVKIDENSIWYLGGSQILEKFEDVLIPFAKYTEQYIFEGETPTFEIAPFVEALKLLGFSVYIDTGNGQNIVSFFFK